LSVTLYRSTPSFMAMSFNRDHKPVAAV
jgi:hypothetical protein